MGLLAVKKLQRKRQWDEQILPWSSHNFAPNFSPNFLCIWYLTCHYAERSDLGIIGKIFSTCRSWVYMYANFGQKWLCQKWKAKARHGLHNRIAKLENKSSNINSCLKSCSNCMDTSDIEFVWPWPFVYPYLFQSWSDRFVERFFFKNSIDVRQWILLVSPGKSLLPHPSPKFPQFILPLLLLQSSRTPELTMANLIPGSQNLVCQLGS